MDLTVRPIPYGLRRDEMLFQAVNSLQQLETIIDFIFESIDQKIASFGPILSDINVRTNNCGIKLKQLKTWNTRATKVFSSNKYPKSELIDKKVYKSVCNEIISKLELKHIQSSSNELNNNCKRFGQLIPFDDLSIDEKINFFKFNYNTGISKIKSNESNISRIGSIQWYRIQSLSSLLVFNTSEIAFASRSSKSTDLKKNLSKDVVDSRKRLDSAPKSMTTPVQEINELHFMASMTAPQLMEALPTALPSLPGIADEFVSDSHNIFQSETNSQNQWILPNLLPVLPNFDFNITTNEVNQNIIKISNSSQESQQPLLSPLPPPPPPPPPLPEFEVLDVQDKTKTANTIMPGPPPPPPLPIIADEIPLPPKLGPPLPSAAISTPKENPMPVSIDSGRASLLDSIRRAAGKPNQKPKTIKEKKIDKKLQQKENKELGSDKISKSGGGDLMSDLMSRLALRRDGISGNQKSVPRRNINISEPKLSAMERVSAMIPPPIINSDNESNPEDEDEW